MARKLSTGARMRRTPLLARSHVPGGLGFRVFGRSGMFELATRPRRATARLTVAARPSVACGDLHRTLNSYLADRMLKRQPVPYG